MAQPKQIGNYVNFVNALDFSPHKLVASVCWADVNGPIKVRNNVKIVFVLANGVH